MKVAPKGGQIAWPHHRLFPAVGSAMRMASESRSICKKKKLTFNETNPAVWPHLSDFSEKNLFLLRNQPAASSFRYFYEKKSTTFIKKNAQSNLPIQEKLQTNP